MGGLLGIFSGDKTTSSNSTSNAYDNRDMSKGQGDGSLWAEQGATINITTLDADLAGHAISNVSNVSAHAISANTLLAGIALHDSAAARAAAADLSGGAQTLIGQAIGATVNGQTLQALLGDQNSKVLIAANDNASIDYGKLLSNTTNGFSNLIDAANKSQRESLNFATNAAENAAAASRAATAAAAGVAADSVFAVKESARNSLNFADGALTSINTSNRAAFGFAGDALAAQLSTSNRAVATAENALDASLSFGKGQTAAALGFADDTLGAVIRLVSDTAKSTQDESQATRDFTGDFLGKFYESQKSGDVQTVQMVAQYGAAVLGIFAIAWALRKSA